MTTLTDKVARTLAEARRQSSPIALAGLAAEFEPASIEDAYAVQRATIALLDMPIAGWKIGATSQPIMRRFGIDEPMYGPIFAGDVHASPAVIPAARYPARILETEFAYRLGHDLVPRANAYTRAEVLGAVDAVVPVFEIVSPRFDRIPSDRIRLAIADCGLNGGLVTGRPVLDWRGLDLARHPVALRVGGVLKGQGTGADALGDPANVLEWVIARLCASGLGLKAGQLISTGTCTGVVQIEAGDDAIGDFGALGQVHMRFA